MRSTYKNIDYMNNHKYGHLFTESKKHFNTKSCVDMEGLGVRTHFPRLKVFNLNNQIIDLLTLPWKNHPFDPHDKKSLAQTPSALSSYLPRDPSRKIYVNAELLFYYIKGPLLICWVDFSYKTYKHSNLCGSTKFEFNLLVILISGENLTKRR